MTTRSLMAVGALLLVATGCRDDAQLPSAPQSESSLAAESTTPLRFRQVSAGAGSACGVTANDQAYCWGVNDDGRLGIGTDTGPETCQTYYACSTRPLAVVGGLRFRSVSVGGHSCGVTTDDVAYCWGEGRFGQLGDGTGQTRLAPVPVAGNLRFRRVSVGAGHSCGLTTTDRIYCWGNNGSGQIGDGMEPPQWRLIPVPVHGDRRFRQVSAGGNHTCALNTDGVAFCWGNNRWGQVGDSTEAPIRTVPVRVAGGRHYRQIGAGSEHTCAVTTDYRAFCWGNGHYGQLGNGKSYYKSFWPRPVRGGLSFLSVKGGGSHTCGVTTSERAYCWGSNFLGELGDTIPPQLSPAPVAGGYAFTDVSADGYYTCGRARGAAIYCWGYNFYGQLGDGTTDDRAIPARVLDPE